MSDVRQLPWESLQMAAGGCPPAPPPATDPTVTKVQTAFCNTCRFFGEATTTAFTHHCDGKIKFDHLLACDKSTVVMFLTDKRADCISGVSELSYQLDQNGDLVARCEEVSPYEHDCSDSPQEKSLHLAGKLAQKTKKPVYTLMYSPQENRYFRFIYEVIPKQIIQ